TPYASPAALAVARSWRAYGPYLPALIVFGVPRALGGGLLTDPRIWFGAAFVATFGAAVRFAGVPRPVWWTLLVTASPVVALPLATGGGDPPGAGPVCPRPAPAPPAARGGGGRGAGGRAAPRPGPAGKATPRPPRPPP